MTREPEWDDEERGVLLGLGIYETDLCDGCNLPTVIRNDPTNLFKVKHDVCPMCAQLAKMGRVQADAEQKAREATKDPGAALPGDGRTARLQRVTADVSDG